MSSHQFPDARESWLRLRRACALATVLAAVLFGNVATAQAGLIINPIFDSTITSDPNAATIEGTINAAIQVYETRFSDPITVTINFREMSTGLGQSSTYFATALTVSTWLR